ncbi:proenkephalin-A-like [Poecilia formosa]|uniref:Proenkephalin-A-like n=1 Tax=Poecilia formosa TaxID=48698 RepID=A0A087XDR6_POEFO|nr:PREDICTED: proenkephalin-A-like [Poecilia formosa]
MAVIVQCSCLWMLLAGTCVLLVAGTDCGTECVRCVYGLQGQVSAFSTQTCSLECEGVMDTQRLRMCQDFLTESDDNVSVDADPLQQPSQKAVDAMMIEEAVRLPKHQIDKKYGGFMKRYGGFLSRRSSSAQRALNNLENNNDEEDTRLGILKIIGATKDHDIEESRDEMEAVKRYAGFNHHSKGDVIKGSLFEAVLGHALKKRYGGFMRRVGRPEWLVDNSKNGEAPKTSGEKESGRKKRYGGFMD